MAIIRHRVIIIPEDIEGEEELALLDLANIGGGPGRVYSHTASSIAYLRTLQSLSAELTIAVVGDVITLELDLSGVGGGDFSTSVSLVEDRQFVSFDGTTGKLGADAPFKWVKDASVPAETSYTMLIFSYYFSAFMQLAKTYRKDLGHGAGIENYIELGQLSHRLILNTGDKSLGPWVGTDESPILHQTRSAGWQMDKGGFIDGLHFDSQNISLCKSFTFANEYDEGISGAAETINWEFGNKHKIEVDQDTTLFFSYPVEGTAAHFVLKVEYSVTAARVITWPSEVKWVGGALPTPSGNTTKTDVFTFYWDGTTCWGAPLLGFV